MNSEMLASYARLVRLPAVFTAWADILAAHLIATQGQPVVLVLAAQLAISTALYWSGMVLNDCFDLEEDWRERPNRPLPSNRIPVAQAWLLGWLLMAGGLVMAAAGGGERFSITLLLALAILAYDGLLKRHVAGPLAMGLCRYLNWLLGLSVLPLDGDALLLALPILIYIAALTSLSRAETRADNRIVVAVCAVGLIVTALSVVLLYNLNILPNGWILFPLTLLTLAALLMLKGTWRDFTPQRVQRSMRVLLLGIVPLDALLAAAGAPWWTALPVLLLLLPGRLLSRVIAVT